MSFFSKEWSEAGVEQLHIPTPDLVAAPSLPSLKEAVKFIHCHGNKGGSVYVHCKAGRTRSATVVACYLMNVSENRMIGQETISSQLSYGF